MCAGIVFPVVARVYYAKRPASEEFNQKSNRSKLFVTFTHIWVKRDAAFTRCSNVFFFSFW